MEEGGNIIRNIFGKSYKEAEFITKDASKGALDFISPKENTFYGRDGGKKFSDYKVKKEEEPQKGFSGWWSPDYEGIRNIPEQDSNWPKAYLEEKVYFQLNVSDKIPVGTSITFQLWDKNTPFKDLTIFDNPEFDEKMVFKTAMVREVNGQHRITIELYLNPKWHIEIKKDEKGSINSCLEFYWTWKYHNTYWKSNNNILDVYRSKTTLFIKPAYEGYGFPEIRTSDGELIVFSAGIVALEETSPELEEAMKVIRDDIESKATEKVQQTMIKYSDKLRYTLAVKELKKGYLVNNLDKIEFSRRLYTKPIFDNEGKLYEITKAANFGYKQEGKFVTTKGISQLDYFKEVGIRNTVLKNAENLSYVFQILDVLKFGMEGKTEIITTMFAPLDFLNAMIYPSIRKPIEKVWDGMVNKSVEEAKDKGLRGIYALAEAKWFNEEKYGSYRYIRVDQEILDKLLKGTIKSLKELSNLIDDKNIINNYDDSLFIYTVLHYTKKQEQTDNFITYIDSIFINK